MEDIQWFVMNMEFISRVIIYAGFFLYFHELEARVKILNNPVSRVK